MVTPLEPPLVMDYIKNFTTVDMVLLGSINDSHLLWSSPLYKDAQYKGLLDVDMGEGNGISPTFQVSSNKRYIKSIATLPLSKRRVNTLSLGSFAIKP